jgi:hypothetical protein
LEYLSFQKTGDSLLQGRACSVLTEKYIEKLGTQINTTVFDKHILWQDGGKVYFFEPDSLRFFQLYDFNKNAGEIFDSYCPFAREIVSFLVDSVAEYQIAEQLRKVQYIKSFSPSSCFWSSEVYEGIGNVAYLFPRSGFVDPPPGGWLECFMESGHTFPSEAACDFLVSANEAGWREEMHAFPNPTTGTVFFSRPEDIQYIQVFDATGNLLSASAMGVEISLEAFPHGLYFLLIQTLGGVYIEKIIKSVP